MGKKKQKEKPVERRSELQPATQKMTSEYCDSEMDDTINDRASMF